MLLPEQVKRDSTTDGAHCNVDLRQREVTLPASVHQQYSCARNGGKEHSDPARARRPRLSSCGAGETLDETTMEQTRAPHLLLGLCAVQHGPHPRLYLAPGAGPSWTGFGVYQAENSDLQRTRNLWDWVQLLLPPLMVLLGLLWLANAARSAIREALGRGIATIQETSEARRRQMILDSYQDSMSEFLLKNGLRTAPADATVAVWRWRARSPSCVSWTARGVVRCSSILQTRA